MAPSTESYKLKPVNESEVLEEAVLCQWFEFSADVESRRNLTVDQTMVYLHFLNDILAEKAFISGPRATTADTTVQSIVCRLLYDLSFHEKEKIPHLGRWFNHMQSQADHNTIGTVFSLTPLY